MGLCEDTCVQCHSLVFAWEIETHGICCDCVEKRIAELLDENLELRATLAAAEAEYGACSERWMGQVQLHAKLVEERDRLKTQLAAAESERDEAISRLNELSTTSDLAASYLRMRDKRDEAEAEIIRLKTCAVSQLVKAAASDCGE